MEENEFFFGRVGKIILGLFFIVIPSFPFFIGLDNTFYIYELHFGKYNSVDGIITEELFSEGFYSYVVEYKDHKNLLYKINTTVKSNRRQFNIGENLEIRYLDEYPDKGKLAQELGIKLIAKVLILPIMMLLGVWIVFSNLFDSRFKKLNELFHRFRISYPNEYLLIIQRSKFYTVIAFFWMIIIIVVVNYLLRIIWIGLELRERVSLFIAVVILGFQAIRMIIIFLKKPFYSFDLLNQVFIAKNFNRSLHDVSHLELMVKKKRDETLYILRLKFIDNSIFDIDESYNDQVLDIANRIANFTKIELRRL